MIPRTHIWVIAALIAVDLVAAIVVYPYLPDPCPTHWNFSGEPDAFGPPWKLAFLVPAIGAGLVFVLWALPLLGPFRANFERFRVTYGRVCLTTVAVLLALHAVFLGAALGQNLSIGRTLSIICGIMLAVMGNWMGKVRRNFYLGIRTPWTLANEQVWERTHRAGGRVMVAIGIVSVAFGLFAGEAVATVVFFSGVGVLVVWAMVYSLVIYRRVGNRDELNADTSYSTRDAS